MIFGQSVGGRFDSLANTVGDGVAGRCTEEERGTCGTVIPCGQGSLEMGQADDGAGVEGSIDGAEAEDLSLGATGGGSVKAGTELAQAGIAIMPKLARRVVAAEEDFGGGAGPVESAPEFAGDGGQLMGAEASTIGEAVAALHAGPEATVGKAIMCFGTVEMLGELPLRDVSNQADMRSGGLQVLVHVECGEMAAIPGRAEQRREVALGPLERMEDRGELFREREEAAVGGRLLIAQHIHEATGREASTGDAGGEPRVVDFREEAGDLAPTGALAGFAGVAHEHDEEVQAVAGGIDHAVRSRADQVAEGGQKLEEDGGRVCLGVGSDGTDGEPCEPMESSFAKFGMRGCAGRTRRERRRR